MEKQEIWKDIPDYEGIYQASNLGRIRTASNKTTYTEKHGIRHWQQRILKFKGETYKTGYRVSLWKNGKSKDFLVARLIATTFLGKSELTVNHIDGNRFNNNIENLEWCTLGENIRKGFETGLYKTQKRVLIINKQTNEKKEFRSLSLANQYLKKHHGYLSNAVKKGKYENELYCWQLL